MTQENLDVQSTVVDAVQSSPAAQPQAEKMVNLPQSQIDHAFKVAKEAAYKKGEAEALEKFKSQQPAQTPGIDPEEFDRRVAEATQRHIEQAQKQFEQKQNNARVKQVADEFLSKIDASKDEHPDLVGYVTDGVLGGFPNTIMLSNELDNTADLIAEFKNHPSKMVYIEQLIERDPYGRLARQEMKAISESIKSNKNAKQRTVPNPPLSQIKPSNIGVDSGSGSLTVKDWRKIYK